MMKSVFGIILLGALLVSLGVDSLQAQNLEWPVAALVGPFGSSYGDIWIYGDGAWHQRSTWGYNRRPVFAPNGQGVAYGSLASVAQDAMTGSQPRGTLQPHTIWVMPDIGYSDAAFRIADQPDDASYHELDYDDDTFIVRGDPAWSPDSLQLAWVEMVFPEQAYFLAIYTLETEQTERFPISGPPASSYLLSQVLWGQSAILVAFWGEMAALYSPQGQPVAELPPHPLGGWPAWVQHEGREYLGLDLDLGNFALYDPQTGQQVVFSGEFRRAAFGSTSPYVIASYEKEASRGWTIVTADGQATRLADGLNPDSAVISPDGQTWAFADGSNLRLWSASGLIESAELPFDSSVGQIRHLSWATAQWFAAPYDNSACTDAPPTRLAFNMTGRVAFTDGDPLNLRQSAGRDAPVEAQIAEGTVFRVVGGPTCADGVTWWEVNSEALWGWVAEGADGVYFIEPYQP